MALSIGIVGLPNVGKSTLFTALTKQSGLAANYPFATIDPNVGVVDVPDARLKVLADIVHPGRIVPATVEFVDIAGLVKGASRGEGLGNQFLANIREADAICEVVRYFSDPDVVHVAGKVDPAGDVETISTELVLADLATVEKSLPKVEKESHRGDKATKVKLATMQRLQTWLNQGNPARSMDMSAEEAESIHDLFLLTMKPIMYVANVDESQVGVEPEPIDGIVPIPICAQVEAELAELSEEDAAEYLTSLGLKESGLAVMARAAYRLLGLQSFFTAGEMEVKAWTIPVGATAQQAAGTIHSDFARGFIKAETISFEDYSSLGGESGARAAGRLRMEGKDYVVQDGDVMHFRFNV